MKRLGAVLLSAAMVLSLTACGGNTTTAPAASEPAKEPAKEAASEAGNDEAAPAASASAEGTDISGSTLEVAVTYTGDQATTFQGLVKKVRRRIWMYCEYRGIRHRLRKYLKDTYGG